MERFRRNKLQSLIAGVTASTLVGLSASVFADHRDDRDDQEKKIYIMHTGDLHGDTESHPNARGDATTVLLSVCGTYFPVVRIPRLLYHKYH